MLSEKEVVGRNWCRKGLEYAPWNLHRERKLRLLVEFQTLPEKYQYRPEGTVALARSWIVVEEYELRGVSEVEIKFFHSRCSGSLFEGEWLGKSLIAVAW